MGENEQLQFQVNQNTRDITKIYDMVEGLPQKMDNLEHRFVELCDKLSNLIDKLENKYQTKENSELVKVALERDIQDLKDFRKWIYGSVCTALFSLALALAKLS